MLPLESASLPEDAVEVGRIVDAWGIKGWLKVQPYSASPEALFSSKRWYLTPGERGPRELSGPVLLRIREAREHSDAVVACAHDVPDRSAAEALKGASVWVARSSFPTPAADEYYWVDLIGLSVVNREGQILGSVRDLLSTGPQTVLVLQDGSPEKPVERLIPFVSAYVDAVDLATRRITVDWQADY